MAFVLVDLVHHATAALASHLGDHGLVWAAHLFARQQQRRVLKLLDLHPRLQVLGDLGVDRAPTT